MAHSQRQVIRYVRGLVAVVFASSVALSTVALQAQTVDPPVGPLTQSSVFQVGVAQWSRLSRPGSDVLPIPAQPPQPAVRPLARSSQGRRSNKVRVGVAGALLGGLVGVAIGSAIGSNVRGGDRRMQGGVIGFEVGATIGAVVAVTLAR